MPNYKIGIELDAEGNAAKAIGETADASNKLGAALPTVLGFGAAVGTAMVAAGAAVFSFSSQVDSATDQIGASLGIAGADAQKFGSVIKNVYANNFGANIADVGKAVESVAKTLKLSASDPALKTMTENAFRLRDVFEVDINDSVSAAKTLIENFGVTGDEAFDMIARGYQLGLDRSGDFLDTIGEYSVQFSEGGASANQFFDILSSGLQGGMLGTDKAADLFKEFRVRIQDGSVATKDALNSIGLNADEMAEKFANGGITALQAFEMVQSAIKNTEDSNVRFTAGVGLMGTQFEDLGETVALGTDSMIGDFEDIGGAIESLDTKYSSLGSFFEGMWRRALTGLAPLGDGLLSFVNENLPAIQGKLGSVIGSLQTNIGWLRLAWQADLGGMRTAAEQFMTLDQDFKTFWERLNLLFSEGGETNEEGWARWLANSEGFTASFIRLMLDSWGLLFVGLHELQLARTSAMEGDWEAWWGHMGAAGEAFANNLLNFFEFVFGPELRNNFLLILGQIELEWQAFWARLTAGWQEFWAGVQELRYNLGLGGEPTPVPVTPLPGNQTDVPITAPGAKSSMLGGTVNHIQVYVERGDFDVVREATELGVGQAQRKRGE